MNTSKQQAIPSQQPQPVAPHPPPRAQVTGPPDVFVNMIEGPAISIGVGRKENFRTFVLPCRLLAQHSLYVYNCLNPPQSSFQSTKKRKLSQVSCNEDPLENTARTKEADMVIKVESDTDEKETKEEKVGPVVDVQLLDVDPSIFGLFLCYIYKDAYPRNVDGVLPSGPYPQYAHPPIASNPIPQASHHHPTVNPPIRTEPVKHPFVSPGTHSSTNIPGASTTANNRTEASTSAINSKATDKPTLPILTPHSPHTSSNFRPLNPNSTPQPPATPAPSNHQIVNTSPSVPASIQAHFLGYRLGACAFINYTMTRIYNAIGAGFRLTPHLVYVIWYCTHSLPQAPLRRLILDYLVTYWSYPDPRVRGCYIHPDERSWEILFDQCKDLRNGFIRGMQNRVKVSGPEAYCITREMMADSNWEKFGLGPQSVSSAGPRTGSGPDPGAGQETEGVAHGK